MVDKTITTDDLLKRIGLLTVREDRSNEIIFDLQDQLKASQRTSRIAGELMRWMEDKGHKKVLDEIMEKIDKPVDIGPMGPLEPTKDK